MSDTETTAAKVRRAFADVPPGSRYYVTSIQTPTGGARVELARRRIDEACGELREALHDRSVTNVTLFVLYDGEPPAQGLLPLGGAR